MLNYTLMLDVCIRSDNVLFCYYYLVKVLLKLDFFYIIIKISFLLELRLSISFIL